MNFDVYGEEFADYLYQSRKLLRYLGNFYKRQDFLKPKLERMSLIHINFEESRVFTVTKVVDTIRYNIIVTLDT